MAKKKREKVEVILEVSEIVRPPDPSPPLISTREQERPKGSIRIVRGRKDAK